MVVVMVGAFWGVRGMLVDGGVVGEWWCAVVVMCRGGLSVGLVKCEDAVFWVFATFGLLWACCG